MTTHSTAAEFIKGITQAAIAVCAEIQSEREDQEPMRTVVDLAEELLPPDIALDRLLMWKLS